MTATPAAMPDLAVFIGRFQPLHNGHLRVIRTGLAQARRLLVVIGSAEAARRPDHLPFTAGERAEMILASLESEERARVSIGFTPDLGDLDAWANQVRDLAREALGGEGRIALIGCSKDRSSYYLRAFPDWAAISVPVVDDLSATPARAAYFDTDPVAVDAFLTGAAREQLPAAVIAWLQAFRARPEYQDMVEELAFVRRYRQAWSAAPYPPVFVTADAVVVHEGKVLLIRRRGRPGKGQWALPGGFLEQDEFLRDAAIRELAEETGLAVAAEDLRRLAIATRVFDAPWRDMRGRTITHATLFRLPGGGPPPAVAAADDADAAQWVDLADLRREAMFSDHYQVIQTMTALT